MKKIDEEKSKMNIQRVKGLGEMNPYELWNTTLDPETRNLIQVQYSKDLKKDQSLIHTLMGNDVALRKDFIVSNAINVRNLLSIVLVVNFLFLDLMWYSIILLDSFLQVL